MDVPPQHRTTPIGRLASLSRVLHPPGEPPDLITPPSEPPSKRPEVGETWEWR